jgi:Fic family protein
VKRSRSPLPIEKLLDKHRDRLPATLRHAFRPTVDGRYLHWDTLRRLDPPGDLSCEEWWTGIKLSRSGLFRQIPLRDARGRPFRFMLPDPVQEALHRIDSRASGRIGMKDTVANRQTRDRFIVNSLIQEAITSSQLEGASTTRAAATRMIRAGRRPRDRSEQMILNNYRAMQAVRTMKDSPLTAEAVLALHVTLTADTLRDPAAAGRLQRPEDERVEVCDANDQVLYLPPPAEQLPDRLNQMVQFANRDADDGAFLHPVVRAIVLHFWLAFDHPFEDGNGRTARALFYWAMLRHDYWMFEFVSISRFLKKAPAQYARAFLHTETDGNDLTYFIVHQVDVIRRAIEELDTYLETKVQQVQRVEQMLKRSNDLNHRQLALLAHAVRHPDAEYTTRSHQTSHDVAYATARADLFRLAELGLLEQRRIGRRTHVFRVRPDLEARLESLAPAE